MNVIEFNQVWEKYRIKFINEKKVNWEEFYALKDINFKIEKGRVFGLIGQNGAGKTTLLKLIAGILIPDRGEVKVEGRVSTLMELGAGFNPEFTGRENITLNARIYGISEEKLQQKIGDIVEFAEVGRFIDAPVKYYSQGMYMRLAFALAIFVDPDILLIDDILAVGDEQARQKCIKKIFDLKESGKTIILVSHDMEMVNKLCSRVILLNKGMITKDGPPQKVIPYYLETVGDNNSIIILEQGKIRLVFNNGRISLSCGDDFLTRGTGSCVSFFMPSINSWIPSVNLLWEVKNSQPDQLAAIGRYGDGTISQFWLLHLSEEKLSLQVEINDSEVEDPHFDLFLATQYQKWFTLESEGNFPQFAHRSNWQGIGLMGPYSGIVGVSSEEKNNCFPDIIIGDKKEAGQVRILNTGYDQEARVIQKFFNRNCASIEIAIISERAKFESYIISARKILLLKKQAGEERIRREKQLEEERICKEKQAGEERIRREKQLEEEKIRTQHTICSGFLRLFIDRDSKLIRIYYKDNEITKARGLNSSFNVSGEWFCLHDGQWQIEKVADNQIMIRAYYGQLSLLHIWTLCLNNDILQVKIDAEVQKSLVMNNQDLRLDIYNGYSEWLTWQEKGVFSQGCYIDDIFPVRLRNCRVSKVLVSQTGNNNLPILSLEVLAQRDKEILSIYKRKEKEGENICLGFSKILSREDRLIVPGKYNYFEGRIVVGQDVDLEATPVFTETIKLVKDELQFVFDQGRGSILFKGKELTTGLGLYTSVRSLGIWHDSSRAYWQVNEKSRNKIVVSGDWPYLPISQSWQIELMDDSLLLWRVEMQIYDEINIDIEQSNLMLPSGYKRWVAANVNNGEFLDEYTQDYISNPYRFWFGKIGEIAAQGESWPTINFKSDTQEKLLRTVVENSDDLYSARILQFHRVRSGRLALGQYNYFTGAIKIEPTQ